LRRLLHVGLRLKFLAIGDFFTRVNHACVRLAGRLSLLVRSIRRRRPVGFASARLAKRCQG
jgi:hypothetical protein